MYGTVTAPMAKELIMPPIPDELLVRLRVDAFMAEYVHTLDADRLESWPDLFTEDAIYKVCTRENYDRGLPLSVMSCSGRGMFRDRITALRTANIFEPHVYCHVIGALRVLESGAGRTRTESNFQVIRTMVDGTMSVFACGRSLDTFSIEKDKLRLSERIVILDSRQIDTLLVIPL
jgi:anthranilate 1,2-dioxygenase small subunit